MNNPSPWKTNPPEWPPHGSSGWPGHRPPPWMRARLHKRRYVIFRFGMILGAILVIFLAGFGFLLWLFIKPPNSAFPRPESLLSIICAVPLVFIGLAILFSGFAFRRFGMPLVDVMAAADAVAEGDFSVRVREDIPGEFGQLARSFNRMTAELAEAEQQRRNLTADVAHELRTPLHIIQGNLEGILDGVYQPTDEHISATLEETQLLARLVSDLQTLSLAESGQLPLYKEQVEIKDLLEDTLTSFAGPAGEEGVELAVDPAADGAGLTISADSDRLSQVLNNLVANALRYTPSGGKITLRAESVSGGVRLEVADTGQGIAGEDLPHIFDRFWKADRSRARREGAGSGLGLAIARQLVQAHGGQIHAASQLGQGTTFTIELPTSASEA
jgi:signal transduction histidine kinase